MVAAWRGRRHHRGRETLSDGAEWCIFCCSWQANLHPHWVELMMVMERIWREWGNAAVGTTLRCSMPRPSSSSVTSGFTNSILIEAQISLVRNTLRDQITSLSSVVVIETPQKVIEMMANLWQLTTHHHQGRPSLEEVHCALWGEHGGPGTDKILYRLKTLLSILHGKKHILANWWFLVLIILC